MAHILIIEDEVEMRFLIRMMLELAEHTVVESQDGQVALAVLKTCRDPFDMITLDLRMPRMDGFEFLSALHHQASYPPVIVITAHWGPIPKAIEHKISGYLRKPFYRKQLIGLVDSLVSQRIDLPAS